MTSRPHLTPRTSRVAGVAALLCALAWALPIPAQLSFSSAVSLALSSSPRVKIAQADVARAHAALSQTHDAYIPAVSGVMDLGYSYGAPIGEPTLFSFSANSLIFNFSQHDYSRAAQSGVVAANLALADVREDVAEDAATTYLSLDLALERHAAMAQELGFANRLVAIVQDRLDAGQDTAMELLKARRTGAQLNLQMLLLDDEIAGYRAHIARIIALPDGPLMTVPDSIPALPDVSSTQKSATVGSLFDSPAVASAFATARSKQEQAFGDTRYLYRPQIGFFAEYSRFSTFNNYQTYYPAFKNNTLNAIGIGIQISIPFYDRLHVDKARESRADAQKADSQAMLAREELFEGRRKLDRATAELAANAELASIDQQMAQAQLAAILTELQSGTGNSDGPQLSPKDEQNARIQERQRYLDFLAARFKLRQTQIQLLRQTGQLDTWMRSAGTIPPLHAVSSKHP
jgi:outer membrane protein TolC